MEPIEEVIYCLKSLGGCQQSDLEQSCRLDVPLLRWYHFLPTRKRNLLSVVVEEPTMAKNMVFRRRIDSYLFCLGFSSNEEKVFLEKMTV
jgi:hypothetical protein